MLARANKALWGRYLGEPPVFPRRKNVFFAVAVDATVTVSRGQFALSGRSVTANGATVQSVSRAQFQLTGLTIGFNNPLTVTVAKGTFRISGRPLNYGGVDSKFPVVVPPGSVPFVPTVYYPRKYIVRGRR